MTTTGPISNITNNQKKSFKRANNSSKIMNSKQPQCPMNEQFKDQLKGSIVAIQVIPDTSNIENMIH